LVSRDKGDRYRPKTNERETRISMLFQKFLLVLAMQCIVRYNAIFAVLSESASANNTELRPILSNWEGPRAY